MKRLLTILTILIFISRTEAANYYLSSSTGSNTNPGTQALPFASLSKLNSVTLLAGDSVLLKRGDSWNEPLVINQSGTSSSRIVYSAYGTGPKPVIYGYSTVSSWTSLGNGVYESSSAVSTLTTCNIVTIDGLPYAMGRYPNATGANGGYLTLQSGSNGSITSSAISSLPGYVGAELVIRLNRSYTDRCMVTAQTSTTISYTPQSGSTPSSGYGFFLENSINTLDQFGEWYFNASTRKLDLYFGAAPPSSFTVRAGAVDTLVRAVSRSYVIIDNLSLQQANKAAVSISGGTGFRVQNCDINYSGRDGIVLAAVTGFSTLNNNISWSNSKGINGFQGQGTAWIINGDHISNTGTFPGMGWKKSSEGSLIGIEVSATAIGSTLQNLTVTNSGYHGIRVDESNGTTVQYCYVDSFCSVKDDGGGIYTWNNNGGALHPGFGILHNIVLHPVGATAGTNSVIPAAEAIYADDFSNGVEIGWNTTQGGQDGIFAHDAYNMNIHDNTCYDSRLGFRAKVDVSTPLSGYSVKRNIFFARTGSQITMSQDGTNVSSIGTLDSNYYCRPVFEPNNITSTSNSTGGVIKAGSDYYSLNRWQTAFAQDANSHKTAGTIADTSGIHLEYNATLSPVTISLSSSYVGVDGTHYTGSVTLQPFTSLILLDSSLPAEDPQLPPPDVYRGVWGYTPLDKPSDIRQFRPYHIKGIHLNISWADLQPTQNGPYNWQLLDSKLQTLRDSGLYAGFMTPTGQNAPQWVYNVCGSFTTSGVSGLQAGPYPDYHSAQYSQFYLAFYKALADHLHALSPALQSVVVYFQVTEGSTGDVEPYHGDAPARYAWTDADWDAQKKVWWDSIASYFSENSGFMRLMFNTGNDGSNIAYCLSRFPGCFNKEGNYAHEYSFNGEAAYFPRTNNLSRGEAQQFWESAGFRFRRETFTMMCSAVHGGLGMLNITPTYIAADHEVYETQADPAISDLFNEFSNQEGQAAYKGMIYLRQPISLDSSYYDQFTTEPVIDPAQLSAYNRRISTVTSAGYDIDYQNWLVAQANAKFANPKRKAALLAYFTDHRASADTTYFNDLGSSLADNYYLNIVQINPRSTSYGLHRVGETTDPRSLYGRDGRGFRMQGGSGEMFFDVQNNMKGSGSNTMQIEVTYLDSGFGTWNVYCYRCNKVATGSSVTNQNTGKFRTVTFTVPRFRFDNRLNGGDFSIRTSADFPVEFIKVTNITKQQQQSP